jgi:hypothetical protein
MNTKEKEVIIAFFGKTYNLPADEVAAKLLKQEADGTDTFIDTALTEALNFDVARVTTINEDKQTMFDNGYKKAQKESLEKFEKEAKEKYGVTSDKKGIELVDELILSKIKAQGVDLDDDKIRKSKVYLDAVAELKKEKEAAVTEAETKYKDLETSIQQKEISNSIRKSAKELILAANPILPEGKLPDGRLKADIQVERLIDELLAEHKFETKDGKTFVHNAKGELMKDAHLHPIEFKNFINDKVVERWDLKEGAAKRAPGNSNDDNDDANKDKKYSGPVISSVDEYSKAMASAGTDEKLKIDITKHWNENQANKM